MLLEMRDFDAIRRLRMDWLEEYRAHVDCVNKTVTLQRPRSNPVTFRGGKHITSVCIVSYMEARRLVHEGSQR